MIIRDESRDSEDRVDMATAPNGRTLDCLEFDRTDARTSFSIGAKTLSRILVKWHERLPPEHLWPAASVQAKVDGEWIEVLLRHALPHGTTALRLYPAGVDDLLDLMEHEGDKTFAKFFNEEYMAKIVLPK